MPPGISELLLAGFLNRGGIPLCRGVTVPLNVPANAEIIIEGYVNHEAGMPGFDPRSAGASLGGEFSKDPSATTPASTRCPIAIRFSR